MNPIYFRITIFLQKSPPQNTKTDTSNLARLLKQLHLPFLRNMANTIVLLQVVIICCTSHSSTLSMASTLNAIPTTEFTPTQFHIQTDDGENRFFKSSLEISTTNWELGRIFCVGADILD